MTSRSSSSSRRTSWRVGISVSLCTMIVLPALAWGESPVVDGYTRDPVTGVVEAPYVVKGITYTQDQTTGLFAGILYQAEDANNLYFAFEQSVRINDNTYGANAIGWEENKQGHQLKHLLLSEHAEIRMYDANSNLTLDFFLDYASQHSKITNGDVLCLGVTTAGSDGQMVVGDASNVTGAGSSLAWNFNHATPTYPNKDNTSPPRFPTNTYDSGTTADLSYPWIYELVYEWSVKKSAFGAAGFGRLDILEVHNSPFKPGAANPVPVPILTVSKTANPPSGSDVARGLTITYSIHFKNEGNVALSNVVVTDTLDENLSSAVPLDGGTCSTPECGPGSTLTWNVGTLNAGESGTVRFTAVVTPQPEATKIYNYATVTSPDLPMPAVTNTTEHNIVASPVLEVAKSCPPEAGLGTTGSYSIIVSNPGDAPAQNVTVVDDYDESLVTVNAASVSDGGTVANGVITWNLAELAAGASKTLTYTGTFVNSLPLGQTKAVVRNSVAVTSDNALPASTFCETNLISPDLAVAKTCPVDMIAGQNAQYSLVVSNSGDAVAANVVVTDTLPAGVTYLGANPEPTSLDGQTVSFSLGNLAIGASATVTIDVTVDATGGSVTNSASVSSDTLEGGQGNANNSDSCSSAVKSPDVVVDKTCPVDMIAGEGAAYTITVSNAGSSPAKNVVLTDTLPAEVSFVSATPEATVNGPTLTWSLGDLDAGASVTVTINVDVVATTGTATNSASAATDSVEGGEGSANNSDSCSSTVLAPDLEVVKTCPVDMIAGEGASYTVTVSNIGTATAKNVSLVDTLPSEVSFMNATPTPSQVEGRSLLFSLGDIAVGGSKVITINVTATATSGTATNTAQATTDSVQGGLDAANDIDSCDSTFKAPDVDVDKTCPADVIAGEQASYSIVVSNLGTSTAKNVQLVDTLPVGVSYVSANPAPTNVVGQTLSWNLGDIAASGSQTVTITVSVDATSGTLTNTAEATTDSVEGGYGSGNNLDSCDSTVKAPDVVVSKSCPVDMIAGTQATYTITVSNSGTATANNVVLTDTLPAEVSFVSSTPAPSSRVGQTLTYNLGDIAAVGSSTVTITVSVDATGGTATNNASATTDSVEGGLAAANNSDSCSSTVKAPDVTVSKTCPATAAANSQASFVIEFSNVGTADALSVVVTESVPAGFFKNDAFIPSSTVGTVTVSGLTVTVNVGTLAPGASGTLTISGTVNPSSAARGDYVNDAIISTSSVQSVVTNDSDSCTTKLVAPVLTLAKTSQITVNKTNLTNSAQIGADEVVEKTDTSKTDNDVSTGSTIVYTLSYSNAGGDADASGVVLKDTLPAGVTFVSASNGGTLASGVVTWNIGTVAAGASASVTVTVTIGD